LIAFITFHYQVVAGVDTKKVLTSIGEAFSFTPFLLISLAGLVIVTILYTYLDAQKNESGQPKYSKNEIINHKGMKFFAIPLSEVGLSAGAIIMGSSLAIVIYFSAFTDSKKMVDTFWGVLKWGPFLYLPLFWFQKSLLAETVAQDRQFNLLGLFYIFYMGVYMYRESLTTLVVIALIFGVLLLTTLAYYLINRYYIQRA
jgi:hypothetical protein